MTDTIKGYTKYTKPIEDQGWKFTGINGTESLPKRYIKCQISYLYCGLLAQTYAVIHPCGKWLLEDNSLVPYDRVYAYCEVWE